MPDTQPPADGDEAADDHDAVLGSVDSLMARLRPAVSAPLRSAPAAVAPAVVTSPQVAAPSRAPSAAGEIPVLTDVISLGPVTARAAPQPAPDVAEDLPLPNVDDLEREVYRRLGDRLDHEVGTLLERRVMPELAVSLDHALAQVATEIKGSLRQLVRETIEETLHQQVRNLRLPLAAEDAPGGDSPDPGSLPPDH